MKTREPLSPRQPQSPRGIQKRKTPTKPRFVVTQCEIDTSASQTPAQTPNGIAKPSPMSLASAPPASAKAVSVSKLHNWEWEQVLLDGWSFAFNGSRPLQLKGRVFNTAKGDEEGDPLEYTSQVISVEGRIVQTRSGTRYRLGEPATDFFPLRERLCRARFKRATQIESYDAAQPLAGVELGNVVPTQQIKLPSIVGWKADSTVSLLDDWQVQRTADRFVRLLGTAFNCPGVQDGETDFETADIVDVQDRVVRTVCGGLFYLGAQRGASGDELTAELAEAELGGLEELLSV